MGQWPIAALLSAHSCGGSHGFGAFWLNHTVFPFHFPGVTPGKTITAIYEVTLDGVNEGSNLITDRNFYSWGSARRLCKDPFWISPVLLTACFPKVHTRHWLHRPPTRGRLGLALNSLVHDAAMVCYRRQGIKTKSALGWLVDLRTF